MAILTYDNLIDAHYGIAIADDRTIEDFMHINYLEMICRYSGYQYVQGSAGNLCPVYRCAAFD